MPLKPIGKVSKRGGKRAGAGRKKLSAYEKYSREFDKNNTSGWDDSVKLSEAEFKANTQGMVGDRDSVVKEVIHQQKWGYGTVEAKGRKEFFQGELKGKAKWSDVRKMSHNEFTEAYGTNISSIYQDLKKTYTQSEAIEFISSYIFGSE